jgi:hypothetical protein
MGLLGSITLNYSGTQAIFVLTLVLGIVVVSSIIPAFLAGKLAVPGNEMRWRVPDPVDDVILENLPFTVNASSAKGMFVFLKDYFEVHRSGAIGHFRTDELLLDLPAAQEPVGKVCLSGSVWLTPFDLGCRQKFRIFLAPVEGETETYQMKITLRRQAGQVRPWWKLNHVFLTDLRRQLLGWRKLKVKRIIEYLKEAETTNTWNWEMKRLKT